MTGSRRKTEAPPREDLLSTSPFDGDLDAELAAAPPPRRGTPSVTLLLGAGVLIVAGFLGGIQADKHWGAKKQADPADILSRLVAGRGGQGGGGQGFGNFGGPQGGGTAQRGLGGGTTGTVKLVDGDIIYVQTPTGIVRVKTTGSTKVTIAKSAKAKNLKTGSSVVVQGAPGQDGTVTATSVAQNG